MTSNQAWFDEVERVERSERTEGTARVPRTTHWTAILPKLIVPMILLIIVGVFVGGYFAFDGDGQSKAKAVTSPTTPAAPAETTREAAVAAPSPSVPAVAEPAAITPPNLAAPSASETLPPPVAPPTLLADLRIDSTPSGATVMLVDRGKTSFLGTTPLVTAIDPSRSYELVFTSEEGAKTHVERVAPKTSKVAVKLPRAKAARAPTAPATEPRRAKRVESAPTPAPAPAPTPAPPRGEGTLMISTKPPCEIHINGAATGLITPQRAIKLPAGKHRITLVNAEKQINKSFTVEITADQATKLIQDLM
jgi:hypothetical protein